ncbi:hypothetical protein IID62_09745 [candidate division KSB1 bacterium]|nr:hypothetical protein [candidate division KSB1 bacterium]
MFKYILLITFALGIISCSSTSRTGSLAGRRTDLITAAEISTTSTSSAYDLIRNLRPNWLKGRGQKSLYDQSLSYPVVYLNGYKFGDLDSLRGLSSSDITVIRFLNAIDAAAKFGLNHVSGAILITVSF